MQHAHPYFHATENIDPALAPNWSPGQMNRMFNVLEDMRVETVLTPIDPSFAIDEAHLSPDSLKIQNNLELLLEGPFYSKDEPIELEQSEVESHAMFPAF